MYLQASKEVRSRYTMFPHNVLKRHKSVFVKKDRSPLPIHNLKDESITEGGNSPFDTIGSKESICLCLELYSELVTMG